MKSRAWKMKDGRWLAQSKICRLVAAVVSRRLTSPWRIAQRPVSRALTSAATVLFLCFCLPAWGQYSIDWSTIDGGGGTSTGGVYSVSGTIGQPDAGGPMTNGQYSVTGGFWALPIAVQTPGAPFLFITIATPGFVTISWTPDMQSFVLQQSPSLLPANWTDSPSGATNPIVVPVTPPVRFYRLLKQN